MKENEQINLKHSNIFRNALQIPAQGSRPTANIYVPMPPGQAVVTGTAPPTAAAPGPVVIGGPQMPVIQVNPCDTCNIPTICTIY